MKKYSFFTGILFIFITATDAQVITTFAGTGTAGFSGDGGSAVASRLNQPYSIALDNMGNVIIGDTKNDRIRKVNSLGIITTIAGTGATTGSITDGMPATSARLRDILSVATDAVGNIYFTDNSGLKAYRINTSGIIATFAGSGTSPGYGGDGGPATTALLGGNIVCVATDGVGNTYIADFDNHRVRKVNTSGIITTIAGNGMPGYSGDSGPATNASIRARGIAIDAAGNIYLSDYNHHVVRRVDAAGTITTIAGIGVPGFSGDGGAASAAMLNYPHQIAIDSAGNLFICDENNSRVRRVDPSGIITTIAGNGVMTFGGDGGAATACSLIRPRGIAIKSGCGARLYIADHLDNRVREIVYYNALPVFTAGRTHYFSACAGTAVSLDSLLSMSDADVAQPETWTLITSPSHGVAAVSYSATSTGGGITPSGLTYTAAHGYSGMDTFRVIVNDCGNAPDTVVFYVHVTPLPFPGVIQNMEGIPGIDTLCVGDTLRFTDTVSGGVWGMYNTKATISATGVVTGIAPGADTIRYTVTDSCGPAAATRAIMVKDCTLGVNGSLAGRNKALTVFPNPNDGSFTITLPDAATGTTQIIVTNTIGEKVKEIAVAGAATTLKLDVPAGVYFISAVSGAGTFNTKVVVK